MKRTMLKTISAVLCVIMLLTAAPLDGFVGLHFPELHFPELKLPSFSSLFVSKAQAADTSGTCGDNLTWSYNSSTQTLIINGTGAMDNYGTKVIDNVNWIVVTNAPWQLYYNAIKAVFINSGATSIGETAFYGCTNLSSVTIPNSVSSIGYNAFAGCTSLTSVTIPDNVTSIGGCAFWNCTSLTSVTIPNSVITIGERAFYKVFNIIYYGTASGSPWGAKYTNKPVEGPLVYSDSTKACILACDLSFCGKIVIPDSVTIISASAFKGCTGITSVTIPDSVTSIGSSAFYGCTGLTEINYNAVNTADLTSSSNVFYNAGKSGDGINVTFGDTVEKIPAHLFYQTCVKSVTIGENVISIGDSAFQNCLELTNLKFGNNVKTIGKGAFYGCQKLASVMIPDSVTTIADCVFYNCNGLTNLTVPDSVTSIGSSAFSGCTGLTSVTIPDSVTSIGNSAFRNCTGITSIKLGNNVQTISEYAFYGCNKLVSVVIPNSVTNIGDYTFCGCSGMTSMTIPDSVTSIGSSAFNNCTSLTSVTIGSSVTSIGNYAFYNCSRLRNITIPNSVVEIGCGAFKSCTGLANMTLPFVGESRTAAGYSGVFGYIFDYDIPSSNPPTNAIRQFYKSGGSNYYYIPTSLREITITDATQLSYGAFDGCSFLTNVTIPDGVTNIDTYAFDNCTRLNTLVIPDSVISIGYRAFGNVPVLYYSGSASGSPWGAKTIYQYYDGALAFSSESKNKIIYCDRSAKTVTIPNSVTSINVDVFSGCTGLTSVYITDLAKWCGISFFGLNSNPLYYAHNLYINDTLVTDLVVPDSVASISNYAFSGCTSLTSVTIPDSVTSIGNYAFLSCSGLKSVTIPDSVTSIGSSAFNNCTGLTKVNICDLVAWCSIIFSDLYSNPLYYAKKLYLKNELITDLVIPDTVTNIIACAFYNCASIISVTIPDNVTSIGGYAFSGCTGLTKVNITDLAAWCDIDFYNSYSNPLYHAKKLYLNSELITDLVIPNTVTNIKAYAFYNNSSITKVNIRDSVTDVGSCAFSGCTELTSVTIPDSVTSIGGDAFSGCGKLTEINYNAANIADLTSSSNVFYNAGTANEGITVNFGDNVEKIPAYLFCVSDSSYKPNIKSVIISDSVTSIDNSAFCNCTELSDVKMGNSVVNIGNSAFQNCYRLNDITIPESVTNIGDYTFCSCSGMTSMTIPDSVTSIGSSAFNNCTSLTSVTIGSSVTNIGNNAFYNCTELTNLSIGNSVTSIGNSAFQNCSGLNDITIPDNVTSIGSSAFSSCTGLTSVTIPDSVTNIGPSAFYNIANVAYKGSATGSPWGARYVNGFVDGYLVYQDEAKTKLVTCGNSAGESIVIPASTDTILDNAFSYSANVKYVYLPLNVTKINNAAFEGSNLTEIFYEGTTVDKLGITVVDGNPKVLNATWHYGSRIGDVPGLADYTLTYDANGGSGAPAPQTGSGSVTLSIAKPTKSGYTFKGWATSASATAAQYQPGDGYDLTASVTLYAVWRKNETPTVYTLTYDANGGSGAPAKQTGSGQITLSHSAPTRSGYTFLGWATSSGATSAQYQPGDSFSLTKDTTLYAVWKKDGTTPTQGKVKSVSVDDTTVNWKSSVTLKPSIDADAGVKTTVTYSSSDPSVATVDASGKVTGVKRGTATITCSVTDEAGSTVKDTCKVTVKYTFVQWLIKIFLLGFIWYK